MTEPGWIVFRFSEDMPEAYRPPDLDGLVIRDDDLPVAPSIEAARRLAKSADTEHLVGEAVAYPTERTERVQTPDSGRPATAQVWEIRPLWKVDLG